MTSSGTRAARATAAAVLPTPVGPAITSSGGRAAAIPLESTLPLPRPLQLAPDVVHRHAAHDGPSVRAEVRRACLREIGHEPLHLLAGERRGGLDGGAAGDERERAVHRRLPGFG